MAKIEDVFIKYYSIAFKKPFKMIDNILNQKKGFLLLVKTEDGITAGDCAPLPGFSFESVLDAQKQLIEIYNILNANKGNDLANTVGNIDESNLCPSVSFALKSILPMNDLYQSRQTPIEMNALINCSLDSIDAEIDSKYELGYRILKVKLGRNDFEEELQYWKQAKHKFPTDIKFIFDANRAWSYNKLYSFEKISNRKQLLYFEDPLADKKELEIALKENRIPLALDESLEYILSTGISNVRYAVIKPTLLKNYDTTIEKLRQLDSKVVLSSAFESFVGLRSICLLHNALNLDTHIGIDTFRYFKSDFTDFADYIDAAKVSTELLRNYSIHSEHLCVADLHSCQRSIN